MRKQQKIWEQEHTNKATLPTMANEEPSSSVTRFVTWLSERNIPLQGAAIDIGCGKGRNAAYLAKNGFSVYAFDYVQAALDEARKLSEIRKVRVNLQKAEMDSSWPYNDDFFDFAIDSFSSIDIENSEGRIKYRDELFRTLKPGGYAMISVVSAEDEWEKKLIATSPGDEPHSSIWPQNGKYQKNYTEDELRDFYKEFEIIELIRINKPAHKLGKNYTATNLWMLIKKKGKTL